MREILSGETLPQGQTSENPDTTSPKERANINVDKPYWRAFCSAISFPLMKMKKVIEMKEGKNNRELLSLKESQMLCLRTECSAHQDHVN